MLRARARVAAAPGKARGLIDVKLASASQSQILEAGALEVEVSTQEAGRVRVRGAAGSGPG